MDHDIINLNVGGTVYATTRAVLTKEPDSKLFNWFHKDQEAQINLSKDSQGYWFIDRNGYLFRFVLDYLRCGITVLPEKFAEKNGLMCEAQFFNLRKLVDELNDNCPNVSKTKKFDRQQMSSGSMNNGYSGFITVGYQGSFYFGPQGLPAADVSFRKISRIIVCGRVSLCRDVFKETLNEARDPDRGHSHDRYTSRFYLKHNILEQAFDMLKEANFTLVCSSASGTSGTTESKPSSNTEEDRWAHYTEFVFHR